MSSLRSLRLPILVASASALGAVSAQAAPSVFSASGASSAAIQTTVDAYRADLGALNPNNGSSFSSGRREINWDGVSDAASAPNAFPADFFAQVSPGGRARGAIFNAPVGSLLNSPNNPGPLSANALFAQDLANAGTVFQSFSGDQIILAEDSVFIDVTFVVPGTSSESAFVTGFGAVFLDVEATDGSSLEFFSLGGSSLGVFSVAPSGAGGLSFLGVNFTEGETVGRVRIKTGTENFGVFAAAAPGESPSGDLVAIDDVFYTEPLAVSSIPEPSSFAALAGFASLGGALLRRRRRA